MRDYFSKRGNEEIIKHSFFAKDKKFNTDLKEFEKKRSREELDEISKQMIDEYEFDEYINQCIDRFMLRTLFSLYFDFNEDEYRKDFKNMIEHINLKSDDSESNDSESEGFAKDGYSLLSHRLENPLEYYCRKK